MKSINIYQRGGTFYIDARTEGKRLRLSTKLKNSPEALQFVKENYELFIKDRQEALNAFYGLAIPKETIKKPLYKPIKECSLYEKEHTKILNNKINEVLQDLLQEKQTLKPNTLFLYKNFISQFKEFCTMQNITQFRDFTRKNCLDFIGFLKTKNNKNSTIKLKIAILRHLFEYALNLELIEKNIIFMPKMSQSIEELEKEELKPFGLNQVKLLLSNAKGELKSFLTIAFFTGLRTGEILGLKKEDINLDKNKASIKRTLSQNKIINAPKTKSSYRVIDILPIIRNELVQLMNQEGEFLIQRSRQLLRIDFINLQKSLNIQPLRRLYDTRHSFASIMLSKGEEPMWISKVMLGHSNLNQTFATYAKYLPKKVENRALFLKDFHLCENFA